MDLIKKFDPFITALFSVLLIGVLVPLPQSAITFFSRGGNILVVVLFLLYGARLPTGEVWEGLKNIRLQGAVFLATYLVFPLLGLSLHRLDIYLLGPVFAMGTLYLTLLPSTVQSSVNFTSIAGGNVAGAVCSATLSNILGVLITPGLVLLFMGRASGIDPSRIVNVLLQLVLPFMIGQFLQPWIGQFLRRHRPVTKMVDNATVLMVVAGSVSSATAEGLWHLVSLAQVALLIFSSALVLTLMLLLTWYGGRALQLKKKDQIVLLMCGSKKSLATGLPMATIIFPHATVAAVTVPVIIFHQLQLFVCAVIARRLSGKKK